MKVIQKCSGCLESCSSVSLEWNGHTASIWGFVGLRVNIWVYWTQDSGYMKLCPLRSSVRPWTPNPRSLSIITLIDQVSSPLPRLWRQHWAGWVPCPFSEHPTDLFAVSSSSCWSFKWRCYPTLLLTLFSFKTLSKLLLIIIFRWYQCMRKISKMARRNILKKQNTFCFAL